MFQGSGLPQFSYEGAQPAVADGKKRRKPRYPVVTLVLYFGEERWNKHRSLLECLKIPPRAEGGIAMCEVLDRVEKRGFDLGHHDGFIAGQHDGFIAGQHDGFISGQNNILALAKRMIASGRVDDLSRASTDSEYLTQLLKEEGLQTEA